MGYKVEGVGGVGYRVEGACGERGKGYGSWGGGITGYRERAAQEHEGHEGREAQLQLSLRGGVGWEHTHACGGGGACPTLDPNWPAFALALH